jgi:hypothetical protein
MEQNEDVWFDPGTGLHLHFNEEGKFVTEDNEPFPKGFKNDNAFSDWLHAYVERRMAERGLVVTEIPENGSPIWHTPDAFNNPEKLLILICGAGRIHAGLFSVGVCPYHGLNLGSCLGFIDYAKEHGMEVCILNPNHPGYRLLGDKYKETWGCLKHSMAVFNEKIIPGGAQNCFIVAHSMGGESVCLIAREFQKWFVTHVRASALTDACESSVKDKGFDIWRYLDKHMINWVCSSEEINKELPRSKLCPHRSAGTKDHPLSTGKVFPYIIEFFKANGSEK